MLKWLQIVGRLAPTVLSLIPALSPIAPYVTAGIQEAEQIPGATGSDKLTHAITIARQGIAAVNAQAGRTVVDPNIADATIAAGINTTVGVVNIIHNAHASDIPAPVQGSGGVVAPPPTTGS